MLPICICTLMQTIIVMVAVLLTIAACGIISLWCIPLVLCCAYAYAQRYAVQVVPSARAPSQESSAGRWGPSKCTIESSRSPALALAAIRTQGLRITAGRRPRPQPRASKCATSSGQALGSFGGIQEENYCASSQFV